MDIQQFLVKTKRNRQDSQKAGFSQSMLHARRPASADRSAETPPPRFQPVPKGQSHKAANGDTSPETAGQQDGRIKPLPSATRKTCLPEHPDGNMPADREAGAAFHRSVK